MQPELWKSLRWAASAYAHYLREHAASWLSFTEAGTQGHREWEWEMCMLPPSDDMQLQLATLFYLSVPISLWRPASLYMCVCAYLPTQYPLRFQPLIASSRNISPTLLLHLVKYLITNASLLNSSPHLVLLSCTVDAWHEATRCPDCVLGVLRLWFSIIITKRPLACGLPDQT